MPRLCKEAFIFHNYLYNSSWVFYVQRNVWDTLLSLTLSPGLFSPHVQRWVRSVLAPVQEHSVVYSRVGTNGSAEEQAWTEEQMQHGQCCNCCWQWDPEGKAALFLWDSTETPAKSKGQASPTAAGLTELFPSRSHSTKEMAQRSSDLLEAPQKISGSTQHQISRRKWALVLRTTVLLRSSSISALCNVGHVNDDPFYLTRDCFGEEGCVTW